MHLWRANKAEHLYSALNGKDHFKALRHGSHSFTCNKHHACRLPRKRSPDGASTDWGGEHLIAAHYSFIIYRPRKDEWLSWPSWLISSGRFTHIVVTHQLKVERRTVSVRRPKTGVPPTVLCNQPNVRTQVQNNAEFRMSPKAPDTGSNNIAYRRNSNCCNRWTRFVIIWKHFYFICLQAPGYGLTLWCTFGLLVGGAIQVPQLQWTPGENPHYACGFLHMTNNTQAYDRNMLITKLLNTSDQRN